MSSLVPIALDSGNNTVKVKIGDKIYFTDTVVAKSNKSRLMFEKDMGDPFNFLDVEITGEKIKGSYFVGKLAAKKDGSQESLGGLKCESTNLKVANITSMAAGLCLSYPDINEFNLSIGTGLPVKEFFTTAENGEFINVNKYREYLTGEYTVKFNSNLFDKRTLKLTIKEDNLHILPESYAALLTIISNSDGTMKSEFKRKNIVVMDIGGGSVDVAGFRDGKYIEELMLGFNLGVNEPQDQICDFIKNQLNLSKFTRSDFNVCMYDEEIKGVMETSKGSLNLNDIKNQYYEPLIEKIVYDFLKSLRNKFDTSMIHQIFLVGGGSIEVGLLLKQKLYDEIPNIQLVEDALTRNVEAYYKTALTNVTIESLGSENNG